MTNAELSHILGAPEYESGTSCDMHVHSRGSFAEIPLRFTKLVGVRECYSSPEDIYATAKKKAGDLQQ